MADQLYLSLWFPNFRFAALPETLNKVLGQFARVSGTPRVSACAAYPVSFNQAPIYQRQFVLDPRAADTEDTAAATIENAVAECTEQLHEDTAYEFEVKWNLWKPELPAADAGAAEPGSELDVLWKPTPSTVRILGYGPDFDDSAFEQNGQVRIDFGLDTPWVLHEEGDKDFETDIYRTPEGKAEATKHIKQNIEMLLAFTLSVEKHCGISSRLLWTESGEPLAEKLIARLQRLN